MEVQATETSLKIEPRSKSDETNERRNKQYHATSITHYYTSLKIIFHDDYLSHTFDLKKITELNLTNCDISELPQCVRQLTQLEHLCLSKNKLREVPTCLYSGLEHLESLDLSHNFIEKFDVEPNCSQTIKYLQLNNNQIYNLPLWIRSFQCPNLLELNYNHNQIRNLRCFSPSYKLKLKKLEMRNCLLNDVDFGFFKNIKSLEWLDLSNDNDNHQSKNQDNKFLDIDNLFVRFTWNNLKTLKLNNLTLSILPPGILWIESIVELHLSNCDLSWLPAGFEYLINLELLDISDNHITSLPAELAGLNYLRIVKASQNQISSIPHFKNNLEILDLYDNYLDEFDLENLNRIDCLDLERNNFATSIFNDDWGALYRLKKDRYRLNVRNSRVDGPIASDSRDSHNYLPHSSSSMSDTESDDDTNAPICADYLLVQYNPPEEDWETYEVSPVKPEIAVKNPLVSPSDDEWDGDSGVEVGRSSVSSKPAVKVYREDWMFCDVLEP